MMIHISNKSNWRFLQIVSALVFINGCTTSSTEKDARTLGEIAAISEMVEAGVKKIGLSAPMTSSGMNSIFAKAEQIAAGYGVQVYREPQFIETDLFPIEKTKGKEVLIIYRGTTKDEYLQLKNDQKKLEAEGLYKGKAREEIARRMGRLLSYPTQRINQLLASNTSFRTLPDFGIRASNLYLYYNDLPTATEFYAKTLGMEMVADYKTSKVFRMTADSYLVLSDLAASMHKAEEPKTVALALLTDQLDEWYTYLKTTNTPFKYEYNLKPNRPHDGFVVIDPEGYLLEFERFNPDAENEDFLPQLNLLKTISATIPSHSLGFKATITWLYYKDMVAMERFYQETLGLGRVVDQGWAKVYQSSKSGYIGLVDERRGMHHFTEKKAINVSFVMNDLEGWFTYAKKNRSLTFGADSTVVTTDPRIHTFFGFDPEGYVFEFDTFLPHQENKQLLEYLTGK